VQPPASRHHALRRGWAALGDLIAHPPDDHILVET
jgi:hypothetical protein